MRPHPFRPWCALFLVLLTLSSCSGNGAVEPVDTHIADDASDGRTAQDSMADLSSDVTVLPDSQSLDEVPLDQLPQDSAPQELHDSLLLMGNCCHFDTECESGQLCLGAGDAAQGRCLPDPGGKECFVDSQCEEFEECDGGVLYPACEMLPDWEFHVGTCVMKLPPGCCDTDADCAFDQLCKAVSPDSGLPGRCKENLSMLIGCPNPGGCCWDDSDCAPGKICTGASVCGCIELCPQCGQCMEDVSGFCL